MLQRLPRSLVLAAMLATWLGVATAQGESVVFLKPKPLPPDVSPQVSLSTCGRWTGFYGPIDYRAAAEPTRRRVESWHFTDYLPKFFAWPPGKPIDKTIVQNFAYTLRAFPNHPVLLSVMEQIGRRQRSEYIDGGDYPLECWYLRALQTVPDDPMVRAQYGIYLAHRGRTEEARRNLDIGDKGLCWSRAMQYQIGLANHLLGAFEPAQKNALRAERMGFPATHLKKLLVEAGRWNESLALPEDDASACVDAALNADANDAKK